MVEESRRIALEKEPTVKGEFNHIRRWRIFTKTLLNKSGQEAFRVGINDSREKIDSCLKFFGLL